VEQKQVHELKNDTISNNIYIMPSDKTKRLIVLDHTAYNDILKNSLSKEDKVSHFILPVLRQQKFNADINNISECYKNSDTYRLLNDCKISEPIPSKPYALPKDHKEGQLKVDLLFLLLIV
jgi:hypothetical protein